ncbi:hypothetical protein ACFL0D_07895 [Thermoproteota archaeon]
MTKAFGKHDLDGEFKLRGYEVYFGISSPTGPESWKSSIPSIQNFLDHLSRFSRSRASRRSYLSLIMIFCESTRYIPDQLITLPESKINQLIQKHIDTLATNGMSKSYVNTVNKRLKTFFRANGIKPETRSYYQPIRYRIKRDK